MPFGQATITCAQSPEADLAGYRVYYGPSSPPSNLLLDVPIGSLGNPTAPSILLTQFTQYGVLFFAMTAYDTAVPPNESTQSNIVSMAIAPKLRPLTWP